MRFSAFAIMAFTFVTGVVGSLNANAMILPKNHLDRYDSRSANSNVSQEQFNQIVDHIVQMWAPLAEKHGAKLVSAKLWDDSTVNAYAEQQGKTWKVSFFGGLARRPEITPDGFALVVCHELGHHFAGYAFYGDREWAASEGESDYWATQVCARRIWAKSFRKNAELWRKGLTQDDPVKKACAAAWSKPEEQALCGRIVAGGQALAKLLNVLGGSRSEPQVNTPDMSKVTRTSTSHPRAQCRLDTYMHGALCAKEFDLSVIPGKDNSRGNNSPDAEKEAGKFSCMMADNHKFGYRPRCWFKPQIGPSEWRHEDFIAVLQ